MATQTTVVLNDFGLARRDRVNAAGETKSRYTVSIESQPLIHTFDPVMLGAGPAIAIAERLRNRVKSIAVDAAPATIKRRIEAVKELALGERWATRRYAGGKMGATPPTGSTKLFNDSGRFAAGIVATPTKDGNWTVNFPANRFDPSTFPDGEAGIARLFVRLRELVPEFGDSSSLLTVPEIRNAIGDSLDLIFSSGKSYSSKGNDLAEQRAKNQLEMLRRLISVARSLAA